MDRISHCPKCWVEHSPEFCHERPAPDIRYIGCQHVNFTVFADINRIVDKGAFLAEIRIVCRDCNLPFEFVGVDAGLMFNRPMASPDAQELRAPVRPKGSDVLPAIPGFTIKAN